jgi:hypothetical protein
VNVPEQPGLPAKGQFLVYQAEDGQVKIDVRLQGGTAWLTQAHMAELFQTTIPNVSMHLRNIYAEGELQPEATIQEFLIVRPEGSRQVSRSVEHYNLDAIISVGYRVKSAVATRFRIWATHKLREFIVKGFVLDDERLKNPAAELSIHGVEKTDETGRRCRLVAVRKDLAVHGLEGEINHGGNINSYYDDPHDATGRFSYKMTERKSA